MSIHYIKVAPVDFEATVYDTDDLSTIRGSSLTMAAMPRLLGAYLASRSEVKGYEMVLNSASELTFRIGLNDDIVPLPQSDWPQQRKNSRHKQLKKAGEGICATTSDDELREIADKTQIKDWTLEQRLGALAFLRHEASKPSELEEGLKTLLSDIDDFLALPRQDDQKTTWPLDTLHFARAHLSVPFEPNPSEILARLDTGIALDRMKKRCCAAPLGALMAKPCALTRVLPGTQDAGSKGMIAESVYRRREVGRKQKRSFYRTVLEDAQAKLDGALLDGNAAAVPLARAQKTIKDALETLPQTSAKAPESAIKDFANDFKDIVADAPDRLSLSAKASIAILDIDGNEFGKHRDRACKAGFEGLQQFAHTVEGMMAGLLARLLLTIANCPDLRQENGTARFETLLWGADEATFVAPGWTGWRLAEIAMDEMSDWVHPHDETISLTFGAGVLFAPATAPIRATRNLAEGLKARAKAQKDVSRVQSLAIEGYDYAALSDEAFYKLWLGGDETPDCAFVRGDMTTLTRYAQDLRKAVGHGKLVEWAGQHRRALAKKEGSVELRKARDEILEEAGRIAKDGGKAVKAFLEERLFDATHPLLGLAHLDLLYDYLPSEAVND